MRKIITPSPQPTSTRKRPIRNTPSPSSTPSSPRLQKKTKISQQAVVKVPPVTPNRRQLRADEVMDVDDICTSLKQSHQEIDEEILKSLCSEVIIRTHHR